MEKSMMLHQRLQFFLFFNFEKWMQDWSFPSVEISIYIQVQYEYLSDFQYLN